MGCGKDGLRDAYGNRSVTKADEAILKAIAMETRHAHYEMVNMIIQRHQEERAHVFGAHLKMRAQNQITMNRADPANINQNQDMMMKTV